MPSVILLRLAGHEVEHIGDFAGGSDDPEVVAMANEMGRTILTFDSALGTLAHAQKTPAHIGIVYFRIFSYRPGTPGSMFNDYLSANPEVDRSIRITVLDPPVCGSGSSSEVHRKLVQHEGLPSPYTLLLFFGPSWSCVS